MILVDYNNFVFINYYKLLKMAQITQSDFLKNETYGQGLFYEIINNILNIGCVGSVDCPNRKIILCLESKSWRSKILPSYKTNRTADRAKNKEVYDLIYQISNQALKTLEMCGVPNVKFEWCEGDDVIAILSKFVFDEKITIVSNDKDITQLINDRISVLSYHNMILWNKNNFFDKNKQQLMEELIYRGDGSDNIPSVVKNIEFSKEFLEFLTKKGKQNLTPYEFAHMDRDERDIFTFEFNIYETYSSGKNKGKPKSTKLFFKRISLTESLLKNIKNGVLKNKLIDENINRNRILVDFNFIPESIRNKALKDFDEMSLDFNKADFDGIKNVTDNKFLRQSIFQYILIQQIKENKNGN